MGRRWAIWAVIVAIFVAVLIAAAVNAPSTVRAAAPITDNGETFDGKVLRNGNGSLIALVPITGDIADGNTNWTSGSVGGDDLINLLDAIEHHGSYRAVVLEMDTPGGAVLASREVSAKVAELRAHHIPVIVWMRGTDASGGYYISSAATWIVASPVTMTGSIGVILEYLDVAGLAHKLGVQQVVVKSGKLKDMGSPYSELTPTERSVLQETINEAYKDFVAQVASGRKLSVATVRKLADGRIYTGRQALKLGLVDQLGSQDEVYAATARFVHANVSELRVVQYAPHEGFFAQLSANAASQSTLGNVARSLGLSTSAPASAAKSTLPTIAYKAAL